MNINDLNFNKSKRDLINELLKRKNELLKVSKYTRDEIVDNEHLGNKMLAGIVGFAVGDALGVPIEFSRRENLEYKPLKEMIGYGVHYVPAGTWSDDTSMMLATMDSIIENENVNYKDMMNKFFSWYNNAEYTATHVTFDVGNATRKAILKYSNGTSVKECGCKKPSDNGNGSLMRILPIVYYLASYDFTEDEEVKIINRVSSLTHAHEVSRLGCKIYCDYVKQLLNGRNKYEALRFVREQNYSKYYSNTSISKYQRILNGYVHKVSKEHVRSTGYVVDTINASLWCLFNSDTYEDAVVKAVNLGGDTDTIGAITGSMAGIMYGIDQIPKRWLYVLKRREYLEYLSKKFVDVLNVNSKNKRR